MKRVPSLLTIACLALASPSSAQQDFSAVQITSELVAPGVYMLQGSGGNIGVSVGPDGVFLIDDQYAPLTDRILAAIARITPEPVRFVLNTHWHGDHTGGNENLGRAGAVIVAHDNVRERMSVEQVLERIARPVATTPASPAVALPIVTFTEEVTFHLNGDEIHAFHVENAHTDGDVIVHFRGADVVHMGDTFFRDRFPFIDTATGGSIDGVIAAAGLAIGIMGPNTKVIPGHGALSTRADLIAYRDALQTMRDEVEMILNEGHPLEHLLDFRPARAFAEAWGTPTSEKPAR
jgi:glyoxylase-like metal-dependent hydrolase (beta-lactamase superfamily II)